jgi:hypothetical protein
MVSACAKSCSADCRRPSRHSIAPDSTNTAAFIISFRARSVSSRAR